MRRISCFAIFSGAIFLAFSIAAPSIIRWQMHNAMSQFNALDRVDMLVAVTMEKLGPALVETGIHSVLAIVAGILMYRRRKAGYRLLLAVGLWAILAIALGFAGGELHALLPVVTAAWWLFVLVSGVRENARMGAAWWRLPAKTEQASETA